MSLGLMTLVAHGAENAHLGRHESYEDMAFTFPPHGGSIQILRNGDIALPKYMIFRDPNLSLEAFKDILKDVNIDLIIGGSPIAEYNLGLLMELFPVKKVRDSFIVKFP